jgi:hypothetical protein
MTTTSHGSKAISALSLTLAACAALHAQGPKKNNIPPTVSITAPSSGSTFNSPATITIQASASDPDGSIKRVEYLSNGTVLGSTARAPHEFRWSNVPAGSYSLQARAVDDRNARTTSAAVSVSVTAPAPPPTISKARMGEWSSLINFPNPAGCSGCGFLPIHMNLLPNGKILMWQDDNPSGPRGSAAYTVAYVWDVTGNVFTPVHNATTDIFCSGHAFLPDGTLLAAGGHQVSDNNGTATTNLFNYNTNTWTLSAHRMAQGRWYPTVTTLPNGEVLVVSGNKTSSTGVNAIPEVWQTLGGGWRQLTTASLSQPLYPWMHVSSNGKVFDSGPSFVTRYLDTSGTGQWTFVANHVYSGGRDYGSSVMYNTGKVLVVGGGAPTATAETIDLNSSAPAWQSAGSMSWARRQMSAVVLPNGKVLVTGGSSSPGFNDGTLAVLQAELWDPVTRGWSTMASMQVPRMYHSNALLLPDGRVVQAGGGRPAASNTVDQPNAQIYSPTYLFNSDGSLAARPVISSAPSTLTYGQQFTIGTAEASAITEVTLVALGSFTHSFDQGQRFGSLSFTVGSGVLNVIAPATGNVAPPGPYMLFVLKNGVPSLARMVRVGP